jgi:adenosylmethionine-8-amino-7-oxononanoate aminotransferase
LAAVQIDPERIALEPDLPAKVLQAMRSGGVLSRVLTTGALQVSPALVIDAEGLAEIVAGIAAALDSVA